MDLVLFSWFLVGLKKEKKPCKTILTEDTASGQRKQEKGKQDG